MPLLKRGQFPRSPILKSWGPPLVTNAGLAGLRLQRLLRGPEATLGRVLALRRLTSHSTLPRNLNIHRGWHTYMVPIAVSVSGNGKLQLAHQALPLLPSTTKGGRHRLTVGAIGDLVSNQQMASTARTPSATRCIRIQWLRTPEGVVQTPAVAQITTLLQVTTVAVATTVAAVTTVAAATATGATGMRSQEQ